MKNFSSLLSAAATLLDVLTFAGDVLLLLLSLSAARALADVLRSLVRSLTWFSELVLLLIALLMIVIGTAAPVVARHAGRWAGRAYRYGAAAGRWYRRDAAPVLLPLVVQLDYQLRQFVAEQFGTSCPTLRRAIAPAALLSVRIDAVAPEPAAPALADLTIRQLKQLASTAGIARYGRLTKPELVAALTAA